MGTVELDGGVGVDGVIGTRHVHISTVESNTFLALDALGSSGGSLYGHIAAIDGDFSFRCDSFGGSYILVFACKTATKVAETASIDAIVIKSGESSETTHASEGWETTAYSRTVIIETGKTSKGWETTANGRTVIFKARKASESTHASEWRKSTSKRCAVISESRESAAEVGHFTSKTSEIAKAERLFAEIVARSRHVEREVFDGNVFFRFDASTTIARCHDVQRSLPREQQFVFRPNGGRLMLGGVYASGDGESVFGSFQSFNLHLFLILQTKWSTLLTGKCQAVEVHFRLAGSLQFELSVVAFARKAERQFVAFVQAFDVHTCAVHGHVHTVFCLVHHFCCSAFVADGDVLCMANAA